MRFLYLHGFASSPASRKAQFFADKLRREGAAVDVPALEAEGFARLTISGQLRVIEKAAAGEAVRLVGSSMGGYLAALYASLHPQVERVLMLAPAFGFAERWHLRLGEEKMREWEASGYLELMHYASGKMDRVGFGLIEDGRKHPAEPDFTSPGMIFHGRADDIVPVEYSEAYVARRPGVSLTVVGSGHEMTDVMDEIWEKSRAFLLS
jgi:uncharacterized protein